MSSFSETWRTNYFHVKSKELLEKAAEYFRQSSEDFNMSELPDGSIMMGGYGSPSFYAGSEDAREFLKELGIEDTGDNLFMDVLQKLVAEDDAIIYKSIYHEGLKYVSLYGAVITQNKTEDLSLDEDATLLEIAKNMLANPEWETRIDY